MRCWQRRNRNGVLTKLRFFVYNNFIPSPLREAEKAEKSRSRKIRRVREETAGESFHDGLLKVGSELLRRTE
jgi:hypothetical protein